MPSVARPSLAHWFALVLLGLVLLAPGMAWSQAVPGLQPIPPLTGHVIDTTATLSPQEAQALEAKLTAFETAKGSQVVVLMVPSTLPEDIVDYAQRVGDLWKIGRKEVGDGVLLIVAKDDRKLRIATAKTLEGAIPDLAASQIIEKAITPRFRTGDFAGGLNAGIDQITALISGEPLPAPSAPQGDFGGGGTNWGDLAVLLFFGVPIAAKVLGGMVGRKAGSFITGGAVGVLAWLFTASLVIGGVAAVAAMVFALVSSFAPTGGSGGRGGRGGPWGGGGFGGGMGGGGGFGGGGFRSGGGGNFGGGGASGRW